MTAGETTGTLGNYVQVALDQMGGQTSRMKDPRNSPLTGLLDRIKNYFSAMVQEHTLIPSRKVIDQFLQTISGHRNLRSTGFNAANLLVLPIPDAKAFKGENELRWVRQREQMFQDSDPTWQASHTRGSGRGFNAPKRNELSQYKDRIAAGLISGDVEATKRAIEDYLAKFPDPKAKKSPLAALKSSYQMSQPLKIGNSTGADSQQALMTWAEAHLPHEEVERMKQLSRTYIETANRAGLKLKEPTTDD